MAAPGAGLAFGWFRFALNTAATFDVFPGLKVTNDRLFYVVFKSAPDGSNHVDVRLSCSFAQ